MKMVESGLFFGWLILLILSAFFSGMEVSFVSSDKMRIALMQKEKNVLYRMINSIYSHPKQFLYALSIGNLIVLVLFVYLSIVIATPYINNETTNYFFRDNVLFVFLVSLLILITVELLPRTIFTKKPDFWVRVFIFPAYFFYILLYPLTKLFIAASQTVLSIFGVKTDKSKSNQNILGRVDLDSYVKKGIEQTPDEVEIDSEVKIFRNALDFSTKRLRDCMIPRADIVAVSEDTDLEKLKDLFIETGLSRILVFREDIDDIIGYIHIWEIFSCPEEWTKHVASISFVPESMQANKLMNDLMQQHKSIAVVIDEFGGTSGIVTMEDLVEEIFGDIEDEYDSKIRFVKQESKSEFVLSGRVEIDTFNEDYNLNLPESEEYSTIAGLLLHYTQRFPKTYENIIIGNLKFQILKVTARKIEVVRLTIAE